MTEPRFVCARCGKRATVERLFYSRWSKNRYCLDDAGCERRAKARRKAESATTLDGTAGGE